MDQSKDSNREDALLQAIQDVDSNVNDHLPNSSVIGRISPHGTSLWTSTARLCTTLSGSPVDYFLKATYGSKGKTVVEGEFASMTCIHQAMPGLCPRPIGHGTYTSNPDIHFILLEFRHMTGELPEGESFVKKMAELHTKATSPTDKFGFPIATCHGTTPIKHGWFDTWEEYFVTTTRKLFQLEEAFQGPSADMDALIEPFLTEVVPRLLRPLENNGRKIVPRLVHGDCWDGNVSVDEKTGQPIIFDAASFYAHHEYELAVWTAPWNKIPESWIGLYLKHMGGSAQPEDDFEDRLAVYATQDPSILVAVRC